MVFQNTVLSSVVNSAGWEVWSSSSAQSGDFLFAEYGNTGAGASGTRASFAIKLGAALTISGGAGEWIHGLG